MLFDLPQDDILYDALIARDPAFDGRAYVCVSTTGIFCRLTCPARKPKRENCMFHEDIASCVNAGYRPCKRCHPLSPAAAQEPAIAALLQALDDDPSHRWQEADIIRCGYDPSTIRRAFKRHFDMTFLDMARQRRLANGFTTLKDSKVIDAQLDAGFDSASAFRTAFARMLGTAPADFKTNAMLKADYVNTPLGTMIAVCDDKALHLLEFTDRKALPSELKRLRELTKGQIGIGRTAITENAKTALDTYFAGTSDQFDIPLVLHGTPFTRDVWTALRSIPAGETVTYGALAQRLGKPSASRAVARANGANQIALMIPCHRVIGADGSLTGYGGGLWRKQQLIEIEKHYARRQP